MKIFSTVVDTLVTVMMVTTLMEQYAKTLTNALMVVINATASKELATMMLVLIHVLVTVTAGDSMEMVTPVTTSTNVPN